MKKYMLLFAVVLGFLSCEQSTGEKLLPRSIGRFNELIIVINHSDWEGKIGIALKKVVNQNVIALPQPEPQFNVTQIPIEAFNGFIKNNRNILIIKKSKKPIFHVSYDNYAKNQIVVHVTGPNKQAIVSLIEDNSQELLRVFKEHDLVMVQKRLAKKTINTESIKFFNKQDLTLKIPTTYSQVDDQDDFLWYRRRFEDYSYNVNGSFNIIAYTLDLDMPFTQVRDSIISIRNALGKKYLPGGTEGTYLITEAAFTPHIFNSELDSKPAYKVYGKWEMYKAFMAGPFVGYYVHDKKNNRLVVVEGVIYAPGINKRNFMFEIEAVIKSLKIE